MKKVSEKAVNEAQGITIGFEVCKVCKQPILEKTSSSFFDHKGGQK